jgi:catalase
MVTAGAQSLEVPPGEAANIDAVVARAVQEMQRHYPPGVPLVRRDAHAKAHGCAKAIFRVATDVPEHLRLGLVTEPGATRKAWVRFSNGAFRPGADTSMDGRGMAVKILDLVPGTPAPGPVAVHDILMINYPVFFSSDVRDYRDFAEAGALTGDGDGLKAYFLPSWNPMGWRIRQGLIAYRIASQKIDSPLTATYFSMTPFAFGEGRAVKYSARPCAGEAALPGTPATREQDFLRDTLKAQLASGPACFELLVQERAGAMPIEDVTVEWSESLTPYRRIATIELPRQDIAQAGEDVFCENVAFSPWNAPQEHRPLGGMNRLRKAIYEAISKYRRERNGVAIPDAAAAWDRY